MDSTSLDFCQGGGVGKGILFLKHLSPVLLFYPSFGVLATPVTFEPSGVYIYFVFSSCHCQLGIQFSWVIKVIFLYIYLIASFQKLVAVFSSPVSPPPHFVVSVLKQKSLTVFIILYTYTHR